MRFIKSAKDISDEELEVFNKFGIYGFDIYERIIEELGECFNPWGRNIKLNKEDLARIEPLFIKLYSQEEWDEILEEINNK